MRRIAALKPGRQGNFVKRCEVIWLESPNVSHDDLRKIQALPSA
jgi:hypothetical protein